MSARKITDYFSRPASGTAFFMQQSFSVTDGMEKILIGFASGKTPEIPESLERLYGGDLNFKELELTYSCKYWQGTLRLLLIPSLALKKTVTQRSRSGHFASSLDSPVSPEGPCLM